MNEPIISVSGLRGIVGESLTPAIAVRYARAFAAGLPPGPLVVARDGRASGPALAQAISHTLTQLGRDVIDAQVAATPTVGILVRECRAVGGIQISASHNPAQYNGMKLFAAAGRVIPALEGQQVLNRYHALSVADELSTTKYPVGKTHVCADTRAAHLASVLALVDVEAIRSRNFKVLVDANRGSGSEIARPLLAALDCRLTLLGGQPDGNFEHAPEPTAENLAGILSRVTEVQADIGFCQDPDADRLAVIDEQGCYLGEEYTLAIVADHVLRRRQGSVVTNCSTSRMTEDLAAKYGCPFFRSAVGEANVVDAMLAHDAVLGGEGNGGVIDPRVVLVRDSIVSMALILDAMAARQLAVSQLADELPRYEIVKTKITLAPARISAALAAIERQFPDALADRLDGLRLDWPDKWLLVRASNTEPIVRAIAEAPTAAEAQRLCNEAAAAISG